MYLSYFNYFSQRDYSFINISSTKQPVWATKESLFLSLIKRLCIANAQTYTCGGHIRAWAPEGERAQVCLGVQRSQSSARHSISCAHIGDIGTRVRHRSHVRTCQWCARTQAHSRALHGACAAHGAKRDNRRRALAGARGEIEHDWNRVVGATLLGDSTQYLVEWNGADWVDVLSCEAWGSAGDPSHTADELELEENICSDEISLQVERRWVNGTIVSFDTRSKMHFVVLANGVRMGVSLANAKPPWKLACITAQTWAAYMPHCE